MRDLSRIISRTLFTLVLLYVGRFFQMQFYGPTTHLRYPHVCLVFLMSFIGELFDSRALVDVVNKQLHHSTRWRVFSNLATYNIHVVAKSFSEVPFELFRYYPYVILLFFFWDFVFSVVDLKIFWKKKSWNRTWIKFKWDFKESSTPMCI